MNVCLKRCALLLLLSLAGLAHAEPSTEPATLACPPPVTALTPQQIQSGMRDAQDHGFLWRITRDGRSSYLYGTVHVSKMAWMFPGPRTKQALAESDTVALELDMLDPDIATRLVRGLTPAQPTPVPPALQQRLERQMRAQCLEPAGMARFSPEIQMVTLTTRVARAYGLETDYGIDNFLAGYARGAKKRVISLETPEAQLALLIMPTAAETLAYVESGLDEIEDGRALQSMRRIARVWAESDYADLARYDEWCECRQTEVERLAMVRLLDDRNPAMAERVDVLHTGGARVFVAVGSLHMLGPAGLPALMARRGYRVERIVFSKP